MNGEPLPTDHGYPARLVVPGLYGYVSATKWVVDLGVDPIRPGRGVLDAAGLVAARADQDGVPHRRAPQRAGRRPRTGDVRRRRLGAEPRRARRRGPHRQPDRGDWQPADLGAGYSNDTWRLWSFNWQATQPGSHTITVRATDNTGAVQTSEEADPVPDGATGWHTVSFAVK